MDNQRKVTCGKCGKQYVVGTAHKAHTCECGQKIPGVKDNPPSSLPLDTTPHNSGGNGEVVSPFEVINFENIAPSIGSAETQEPIPTDVEHILKGTLKEELACEGYQPLPGSPRIKVAHEPWMRDNDRARDKFIVEEWVKPTGEEVTIEYSLKKFFSYRFLTRFGLKKLAVKLAKLKRYQRKSNINVFYTKAKSLHHSGKPAKVYVLKGNKGTKVYVPKWNKATGEDARVKWEAEWWVNGKRHRNGKPSLVKSHKRYAEWYMNGKPHRLDGPALKWMHDPEWWVNGVKTSHPHLCHKAVSPDLTSDEFYVLCSHGDYVVRQAAANNPKCPPEWATFVALQDE